MKYVSFKQILSIMEIVRKILDPAEVNLIIYHGDCSDGFAAALSGYLKYQNKIEYYFGAFSTTRDDPKLLTYIQQKQQPINLLIVDFSYSREFLIQLKSLVNKILVLDHHISAQKELSDLSWCYFDQNRSGCTISWEYFMYNTNYPNLYKCIEDRDLWRWQIKDNKEFTSAFYNLIPFDFEEYKKFIDNPELIPLYIMKGEVILEYIKSENIKRSKFVYKFTNNSGKRIGIVNITSNASEFGDHITTTTDIDFAILWSYNHVNNTVKIGVRSAKGSDNDCSILSRKFNGGGHFNAAGFVWDKNISEFIEVLRSM